jgi:hypothetical protein
MRPIASTDNAVERIAIFHGPTPIEKREATKLAFNEHPSKNPLRILLCNDAAGEGPNLQAHCYNIVTTSFTRSASRTGSYTHR